MPFEQPIWGIQKVNKPCDPWAPEPNAGLFKKDTTERCGPESPATGARSRTSAGAESFADGHRNGPDQDAGDAHCCLPSYNDIGHG